MKSILASIARIRAGSPFRERITHEAGGHYGVIQGKDIGLDGALSLDGLARVNETPGKNPPDVLLAEEVLLQTRGMSYRAAIVPKSDVPLLAVGSLYVLTVDPVRADPEYVVLVLNLPGIQALLRQSATGSTILNLRRSVIEQLEIPLPSLPDQRRLVALGRLVRKQADLEERLNRLRLQELHALVVECAKKAEGASTPPAPHRSDGRFKRPQIMS